MENLCPGYNDKVVVLAFECLNCLEFMLTKWTQSPPRENLQQISKAVLAKALAAKLLDVQEHGVVRPSAWDHRSFFKQGIFRISSFLICWFLTYIKPPNFRKPMKSKDVIWISIFHHTIQLRSFDQVVTAGRDEKWLGPLTYVCWGSVVRPDQVSNRQRIHGLFFSRRCTTGNDEQTWTAAMKFTSGNICDIDKKESMAAQLQALWFLWRQRVADCINCFRGSLHVYFKRNVLVSCQGGGFRKKDLLPRALPAIGWGRRMYRYWGDGYQSYQSNRGIFINHAMGIIPLMGNAHFKGSQYGMDDHPPYTVVCVAPSTYVLTYSLQLTT